MTTASLKEKIGQMLMIGFHGTTLTDELKEMIRDYGVGGVIIFSRNIESPRQIKEFCRSIRKLSIESHKIPPFISIDQEGGRVFRLKPPFNQYPSCGELGRTGSEDAVKSNAISISDELIEIGINMNMAPVLDVNTNPKNPIIGDRAFSSDPEIVSRLGAHVINTFHEKGIIAVGKHYPGHGDTSSDSHLELPVVRHGIERFEEIEFKPFLHAFKNGLGAVMTAHVLYPALDLDYPATMSEKIINGILRKKHGFDGVVITDDLEMKAISNNYTDEDAAILSIRAGADVLLICHSRDKQIGIFESLVKAVENGNVEKKRADKSFERIIRLKNSAGL
ncbi:MAG: beta-N-acetylhexosaminidase [Nitrospinae bacterium]|nr:beta-N-acetylhexosaminidase [Nitrospinota bacterium]